MDAERAVAEHPEVVDPVAEDVARRDRGAAGDAVQLAAAEQVPAHVLASRRLIAARIERVGRVAREHHERPSRPLVDAGEIGARDLARQVLQTGVRGLELDRRVQRAVARVPEDGEPARRDPARPRLQPVSDAHDVRALVAVHVARAEPRVERARRRRDGRLRHPERAARAVAHEDDRALQRGRP
ncbi:hypothetical protein [Sorangium sp. So ce542]|uniref:hypothetical protein n=1 Tax=Sorangium sp. So ce542 TaxID=3133316 RepID=UPI003F632A4F